MVAILAHKSFVSHPGFVSVLSRTIKGKFSIDPSLTLCLSLSLLPNWKEYDTIMSPYNTSKYGNRWRNVNKQASYKELVLAGQHNKQECTVLFYPDLRCLVRHLPCHWRITLWGHLKRLMPSQAP
jgi:hypothetical protein